MATAVVATVGGILLYALNEPSIKAGQSDGGHVQQSDSVQTALTLKKRTVIEFGANSCVACREMKPVLQALRQDPRIVVADIDILKERDYISRYQIRLMPTQVFFDPSGREIGRNMGVISGFEILARLGLAPKASQ